MGVSVQLPEKEGKRVVDAVVDFIWAAGRMMNSIGKKLEWEAELIQKRTPVTENEITRDLDLSQRELDNRQLRTEVEKEELVARREKASADKMEAEHRKRTTMFRSQQLNRNVHRASHPRPSGPSIQPNRSQPASQERSNGLGGPNTAAAVKGPLTQNLGEKLKDSTV